MGFNNYSDKKGIIYNIILSVAYVPMSIFGLSWLFFPDGTSFKYSDLQMFLRDTIIYLGLFLPILSIAGILISVIARQRGKSRFSFIIQFLPIPFFLLMLILLFLMGNV